MSIEKIRQYADSFNSLNSSPNLQVGKTRHAHASRSDAVSDLLGECRNAAQIAAIAFAFGIPRPEIIGKADRASSFGQFRMVIGNRIRGIAQRIAEAKRLGIILTVIEAAGKKGYRHGSRQRNLLAQSGYQVNTSA